MTSRVSKLGRTAKIIVGGVAVALVAAACGSSSSGGDSGPTSGSSSGVLEPVTVRLTYPASYAVPFAALEEKFTAAHPGVTFKDDAVDASTLTTLLQTQFRAGNAGDMVFFNAGSGNALGIQNFAKADYLIDLSTRPWASSLIPQQKVGITTDQKLWGAPLSIITVGLVNNTDIFTRLGVAVPSTFDELLAACQTISAAGTTPIAFPAGDSLYSIFLIYGLIANNVYANDLTWDTKRAENKTTFAGSDGWKKSYQQVVDMKNAKCFSDGAVGEKQADAQAQFANGKAAMLASGTQVFSALKKANPELNFSLSAVPSATPADQRVMLSPSVIMGVNKASSARNQAAALAFADFLMLPDNTALFNSLGGGNMTGHQYANGQSPAAWAQQLASVLPLYKKENPVVPSTVWPNAMVQTTAGSDVAGLFTGQKSVDAVLSDLDAAFNQGVN